MKHRTRSSSRLFSALSLALCLGSAGCQDDKPAPSPAPPPSTSPTPQPSDIARPEFAIEGQYIFFFDDTAVTPEQVEAVAAELAARQGGTVQQLYTGGVLGFQANGLDDNKALAIAADPRVKSLGQDGEVRLTADQSNASWSLDRIDEHTRTLDKRYSQTTTGQGVNVYVLDTGIRSTHKDLGGRVVKAFTAVSDGNNTEDCHGHGTHVAGTIAGSQWGVAKNARLHAVRVMKCDGTGSISGLLAGVDYVTKNHQKPAVANMSLGGGAYAPLDEAIRKSIAAGVVYVFAAGNDNADACNVSPARVSEGLTVAASNINDQRASFSNWGSCVDLFAPGQDIASDWGTADTATKTISGTSMAAPHVAGVAALYLEKNPTATPAAVASALLDTSTANVVSDVKGTPNRLLYSLVVPPPASAFEQLPTPVGATLKQVAVSDANNVWGLSTDGKHWKWNGTAWVEKNCCVTELAAAADGSLWATNPGDGLRVLRWKESDKTWDAFSIPAGMNRITLVNGNTVWGLDKGGFLYQYDAKANAWNKKICCVTQISASSDGLLWATNPPDQGRVLRWNGSSWDASLPTGMVYVSVGSASNIWGLSATDGVHKWNGTSWVKQPGELRQISAAADGTVWGINAAGVPSRLKQ